MLHPDLPLYDNAQSWYGGALQRESTWIYQLQASEIAELEAAMRPLDASGRDLLSIDTASFPLPSFSARLQALRTEVLHGRGFCLVRGLPLDRYTLQQAAILYWGIGVHLGELVPQNGKGHLLGHVTNLGLNYADAEVRGYQTNARLPYHSDASDVVTLLCLRTPQEGGFSSVVSSTTVWNELVRRRPDCARTLMQPLYYTRWGEIPAGMKPYKESPVFTPWEGRMITTYVRSAVEKAQALADVPRLTPAQVEAMDVLDELTTDPALHLDMQFEAGDIQLVSNHSVLHSRTSYVDWPEQARRRHLLRLWLACADGPPVPDHLYARMGSTKAGRPDGIRVPNVTPIAPLVAA